MMESTVSPDGITHEFHRHPDYTIHITYFSKSVAGPDTLPLYSCWVEMKDGRKSGELTIDGDDRYPLLSPAVSEKINNFVDAVPA